MSTPQETVEKGLALAQADTCVVIVDEVTTANLRWASNTLTTNGVSRSRDVTVISVIAGATGVISRQGVTDDSLEDLVRAAEDTARGSTPAEDAGDLIGPEASLGDWEADPSETSINVFSRLAPDLGEAFQRAGGADQLLFGFADHKMRSSFLGTSAGVRSRFDQPTGHTEINAKSRDYARSAWAGVPTVDFRDVDVAGLTEGLSRRLGWAERTVALPAGRYPTILPPSAVSDMMIYLYWSSGGRDAHEGRTVFSRPGGGTRVGERLTDVAVTLRSDPAAPAVECPGFVTAYQSDSSSSVFDNGVHIDPTAWISNGVLSSLVQSRYSASVTGLPFTPYVDNLILDGPVATSGDENHLVTGLDRGLLLTCLWYIREVDPQTLLLTGLTRDGVYLVEGGEVTGAVNNFRFNESPVAILSRISGAGASVRSLPREWCDYFNRVIMPPLLIDDFNMSSVSQAS